MFIDYSSCHDWNCCYTLTNINFLSDFLLPGSCERTVNVETHIRVRARALGVLCAIQGWPNPKCPD